MGKDDTGARRVFKVYEKRARKKGYEFDIDLPFFWQLVWEDCVYCGAKPSNECRGFKYNGLDRVDNTVGYTRSNTVPCCARCNGIKGKYLTFREMVLVMEVLKRGRA